MTHQLHHSTRPRVLLTLILAAAVSLALARPVTASPSAVQTAASDAEAAALAKQVRTAGSGRLTALRTALGNAGFTVIGDDGGVAVTPARPGQGIAFESWEVEAMTALLEKDFAAPLSDTSLALAAMLPELEGAPVDRMLLAGIREHARGSHPTLRFWARFIVELGKQQRQPVDLLGDVNPAAVQLDAVQFGLILRRLTGDLFILGSSTPAGAADEQQDWLSGAGARSVAGNAQAQPPLPCSLGAKEGLIFDAAALGAGIGFGQLIDYLKDQGLGTAGRIAKATGAANLALAYVKFAWTLGAFTVDVTLDQSEAPLTRTKETRPKTGERRQLAAKVRMDVGKPQLVNCFRPMLNTAGLDFSLPTDGALAGAEVGWSLVEGGVENLNPDSIVQFYGSDPTQTVTNADGVATMGIEGTGQRRELPDSVVPVKKQAQVRANAVLKPANMIQDLIDAGGAASGELLGVLGMPAEMLYRTKWLFYGDYTVPVIDWEVGRWRLDGSVADEKYGPGSEGHDPSGHEVVKANFTVELKPLEGLTEAEIAAAPPETLTYYLEMNKQGWNAIGEGTATFSVSSYDNHPGTSYNCRASDSTTGKVTVMGKIKDGKVKLRIMMFSDGEVNWCGGHSTAPRQQNVIAAVGRAREGSFLDVDDATLLEVDLADNAVGNKFTTVQTSTDSWDRQNVRHTITSEVRVTALPPVR